MSSAQVSLLGAVTEAVHGIRIDFASLEPLDAELGSRATSEQGEG